MREPDAPSLSVPVDASGTGATPEVILVKSGFKQVAMRVREILYVEAARNYVRIHLENGTALKSRVQIDRLAQHLGRERFLRIHRGRLVNMERIRSVRPLAGGRLQLTLTHGATIVVARDRRRSVLAELSAVAERRA
jgi:two-component system LytT family response regulator